MRCDFVAGNAKCWQSSHRVFVMILSPSLLKRSDTVCPLQYQRRCGIFGPSSALCDVYRPPKWKRCLQPGARKAF